MIGQQPVYPVQQTLFRLRPQDHLLSLLPGTDFISFLSQPSVIAAKLQAEYYAIFRLPASLPVRIFSRQKPDILYQLRLRVPCPVAGNFIFHAICRFSFTVFHLFFPSALNFVKYPFSPSSKANML